MKLWANGELNCIDTWKSLKVLERFCSFYNLNALHKFDLRKENFLSRALRKRCVVELRKMLFLVLFIPTHATWLGLT